MYLKSKVNPGLSLWRGLVNGKRGGWVWKEEAEVSCVIGLGFCQKQRGKKLGKKLNVIFSYYNVKA